MRLPSSPFLLFLCAGLATLFLFGGACTVAAPPAQDNERILLVSYGDDFVVFHGDAKLDTPERIGRSMKRWRDTFGITTVYWRTGAWFLRNYCISVRSSLTRYWTQADAVFSRFDPYRAAAADAHRLGLKIFAYTTIFDEGSPPSVLYGGGTPFPWQSRFTRDHPEYLVVDRTGTKRQYGVMEYAYPQVRAYKLKELTDFLDRYDYDGVYLCTRSHSKPAQRADEFGFNDPVVRAFRQRYGVDLRTEPFDVQAWRNLRGDFLTRFLREVRRELNRRGKRLAVGVPQGDILGPPYGNMTLDWRTWVKERLVDRLVIGIYSGDWHYPSLRGHDRERGYLVSGPEHWGLPPAGQALERIYRPFCQRFGVAVQLGLSSSAALATMRSYGVVTQMPRDPFPSARLSIELWVKPRGKQNFSRLVSEYDHTLPADTGRGWEVYLDNHNHVVFRVNDGENDHSLTTTAVLPPGEWSQVRCVSEGRGGTMWVAIDGVRDEAVLPAPVKIRQVPVPLFIGRYPAGGRPFSGWLAELRVSSTARDNHPPATAPLPADEDTLLLFQPSRNSTTVPNKAPFHAVLQFVNVTSWDHGPVPGLFAFRLGQPGQ